MKILCETHVFYRQTAKPGLRAAKSTLAIGFHPPGESSELFLMLFTSQNSTGSKWKVKENILKVYSKFINDGKATISLLNPEIDIMIKGNPIQLKSFLQSLKLGLEGKTEINKLGLGTLATTAFTGKSIPIKKLAILKRGDYPLKGIPKSVQDLTISGIERQRFDSQILFLKNLTVLNLHDNCIKKIPKELGKLQLVQIDLSKNQLGDSNNIVKDWKWLDELAIQNSLMNLNLSENKIKFFPPILVKLNKLITLKMNNNEIRKIPFSIRRMTNLRYLHLSNNALTSLPNSVNHLYLDTLDVWDNNFLPQIKNPYLKIINITPPTPNLLELSARVVLKERIPYSSSTIPRILVDVLSETPLCGCGRLCLSSKVFERVNFASLRNISHLVFSRTRLIYQDAVFCSKRCAKILVE